MPLKDAPIINREELIRLTYGELLDMIQELTNKAYYNRQLFEYACKEHVADLREVEMELVRNGIPEDDGYSCYAPGERVALLAKKVNDERYQKAKHQETPVQCDDQRL